MELKILVSACLLGIPCRFDGGHSFSEQIFALGNDLCLIPICPEQLGGLGTPREPAEIQEGRVITAKGEDVTAPFYKGARITAQILEITDARAAILKERSPSCGSGIRYDGSFSGRLIPGNGVTTELLLESGIPVFGETSLDSFGKWLEGYKLCDKGGRI